MNLLETYRLFPGNYLIEADGGLGKTTSLLHMLRALMGKPLKIGARVRVVIPVYIKMAELNVRVANACILYRYMLEAFANSVTERALEDMLNRDEGYQYLLLLDGLNEVNDYITADGQTVLTHIYNNLRHFLDCGYVHCIITSRRADQLLPPDLDCRFQLKRLQRLKTEQVLSWLGLKDWSGIDSYLREMLYNPMLLKLFGNALQEDRDRALAIGSKYELLEQYFQADGKLRKDSRWTDALLEVRQFVLENVLPHIAFCVEMGLLEMERRESAMTPNFERLLRESLEPFHLGPGRVRQIRIVLSMMNVVNEELIFSHDLIREYMALNGLEHRMESGDNAKITEKFFTLLTASMEYRGTADLNRRTRHLDMAELIYARFDEKLKQKLLEAGMDSTRSVEIAQSFYQELAGVYDDLGHKELTSRIGWTALRLLEKREMSDYERAKSINFLFYCVVKGKERDPLCLEMQALKLSEQLADGKRERKYQELYARILSNIGAYYTTDWNLDYATALNWHRRAERYRREHGMGQGAAESCRTVMSDFFHLGRYREAYDMYCRALEYLTGSRRFSSAREAQIPVILVERALGSEFLLWQQEEEDSALRVELGEEIPIQIEYVYRMAKGEPGQRRVDVKLIAALEEKLQSFMRWGQEHGVAYEQLRTVTEKYNELCCAMTGRRVTESDMVDGRQGE